ncbi:hypothetical protein [Escherichia coli]
MKLLIVAFVTLCLAGCQASHKLPPVSGKSEPVNSAEVMQNGILNFPDLKIKKTLLTHQFRLKKKTLHYRRE